MCIEFKGVSFFTFECYFIWIYLLIYSIINFHPMHDLGVTLNHYNERLGPLPGAGGDSISGPPRAGVGPQLVSHLTGELSICKIDPQLCGRPSGFASDSSSFPFNLSQPFPPFSLQISNLKGPITWLIAYHTQGFGSFIGLEEGRGGNAWQPPPGPSNTPVWSWHSPFSVWTRITHSHERGPLDQASLLQSSGKSITLNYAQNGHRFPPNFHHRPYTHPHSLTQPTTTPYQPVDTLFKQCITL